MYNSKFSWIPGVPDVIMIIPWIKQISSIYLFSITMLYLKYTPFPTTNKCKLLQRKRGSKYQVKMCIQLRSIDQSAADLFQRHPSPVSQSVPPILNHSGRTLNGLCWFGVEWLIYKCRTCATKLFTFPSSKQPTSSPAAAPGLITASVGQFSSHRQVIAIAYTQWNPNWDAFNKRKVLAELSKEDTRCSGLAKWIICNCK